MASVFGENVDQYLGSSEANLGFETLRGQELVSR